MYGHSEKNKYVFCILYYVSIMKHLTVNLLNAELASYCFSVRVPAESEH